MADRPEGEGPKRGSSPPRCAGECVMRAWFRSHPEREWRYSGARMTEAVGDQGPGRRGTRPQRASRWWIWLIVAVVVAGVLVYVVPLAMILAPKGLDVARKLDDQNDLRQIMGMLFAHGEPTPLATDGRIDVYLLLREAEPSRELMRELCRSERADKGPSLSEIEAGDYRNYAYQRHRGVLDLQGPERVPVIWELEPTGGEWLVAYSDGAVSAVDESVVREYLRAHPEQE